MKEVGIDISTRYSKSINEFKNKNFDIVITVCDNAKEACPFLPGKKILHKSFKDPAIFSGSIKETLDFFEIGGGYTDSKGYIRDVIPIRNNEGFLVGYGMRDIRDFTDYDNKYIHSLNFDKDRVLYNLNNAKHYIEDKPLIIVEGYKSVWRFWEYGIKNVVAVMGSTICPGQINLLYMYAVNDIVIMFDNDGPGVEGCLKACDELRNKLNIIPIFITEEDENGKGLDPSDLSKDVIYNYLESFI